MEAKLQKLKVTELKELLSKHNLTQTGKKDDLVKRLLENNVSVDDTEEELVDLDESPSAPAPAPAAAAPKAAPTATAPTPVTNGSNGDTPADLTPEQQAMKARAERFGMPFNPNATTSRPTKTEAPTTASTTTSAPAEKPPKAGAIDKAPLGISEEVLAKRAAKFGLPEKTASAPAPTGAKAIPAAKPEVELTPEMKEKIAIEEEKKRKRAEKFGLTLPSNGTDTEPDAKKAKI